MQILPVIDLMSGVVVRGRGGRRSKYRPIVSRLVSSSDPLPVAEAFRAHFGLATLYLADLDAIAGKPPVVDIYRGLLQADFRLWIDAGVHDSAHADRIAASGAGVVVGLETIAGPSVLADILHRHGKRVVFSLDLRDGMPLGDRRAWNGADAMAIAERAVALGARRILVLDLARVGVGQGLGTEKVLGHLISALPDVEVWAGGGIRNAQDLSDLRGLGVKVALVASALHDGILTRGQIAEGGN